MVDSRYKLIHFYEDDVDEWEFYDLKNDPHEMTNAFKNPEYANEIKRMQGELSELRKKYEVTEEDPPQTYQHKKPKPLNKQPEKK